MPNLPERALHIVSSRVLPPCCPICRQRRDPGQAREATIRANLCGAVKYGWCPACLREVLPPWPRPYRARWRRGWREREGRRRSIPQ